MPDTHRPLVSDLLIGGLAGIVGTYAMTEAKRQLFPRLRGRERYPLPPREITQGMMEKAHGQPVSSRGMTSATLAAHFAFGAGCGMVFTLLGLHRRGRVSAGFLGMVHGLGVWTSSYLGWLPLAGILTPATRHPARRNALMIAVHLVWGGATGLAARGLSESRSLYEGHGRQPDRG